MTLHHYLPATYLARFSLSNKRPRRNRQIWVGDKKTGNCFKSTASKVGAVHDHYKLTENPDDPYMIEKIWSDYESELDSAVEQLLKGTITAKKWTRTLIPFASCLMVRGPDFNIRFDERIRSLGLEPSVDTTNSARFLELQRILGQFVGAQWLVLTSRGDDLLITSDIGYSPYMHQQTKQFGIAIPLDNNHILGILPKRRRKIADLLDGIWYPVIEYHELFQDNHIGLNRSISANAQRFIFGPNEKTVRDFLVKDQEPIRAPEPEEMGFRTDDFARVHEFSWHRIVSMLEKDPNSSESWDFDLDIESLVAGWAPPLILPTNLPSLSAPSPYIRKQSAIYVNLYNVNVEYEE